MNEKFIHLTDEQLQGLLDKTYPGSANTGIQQHLAACPDCQHRLDRLEKLTLRLQALPEVKLSRDLSRLVVSQLRDERQLWRGFTWTLVFEALAAGAAIGLLITTLQAAGWVPRLLNTRQELLAALNIFFTQLASTWLVWGAELKLLISQQLQTLLPLTSQPTLTIHPWILVAAAGGLGLIINYFLLGRQPLPGRNQEDQ